LTNPKEMIAELSNPEFREGLKKINVWDRIKNAIKKIFFFDTPSNVTAYRTISNALDKMLDNFDMNLYEDYARTKEVDEKDWNFQKSSTKLQSQQTINTLLSKTFVPARYAWGVWDDFKNEDGVPIDVDKTLENISKYFT